MNSGARVFPSPVAGARVITNLHPMNIPSCSAIIGMAVLLGFSLVSDGVTADVAPSKKASHDAAATTPATEQTPLEELRAKRQKVQAELDTVSQPKTLAAGAPPGSPREELLERRTLLHHIFRLLRRSTLGQRLFTASRRRRSAVPAQPD